MEASERPSSAAASAGGDASPPRRATSQAHAIRVQATLALMRAKQARIDAGGAGRFGPAPLRATEGQRQATEARRAARDQPTTTTRVVPVTRGARAPVDSGDDALDFDFSPSLAAPKRVLSNMTAYLTSMAQMGPTRATLAHPLTRSAEEITRRNGDGHSAHADRASHARAASSTAVPASPSHRSTYRLNPNASPRSSISRPAGTTLSSSPPFADPLRSPYHNPFNPDTDPTAAAATAAAVAAVLSPTVSAGRPITSEDSSNSDDSDSDSSTDSDSSGSTSGDDDVTLSSSEITAKIDAAIAAAALASRQPSVPHPALHIDVPGASLTAAHASTATSATNAASAHHHALFSPPVFASPSSTVQLYASSPMMSPSPSPSPLPPLLSSLSPSPAVMPPPAQHHPVLPRQCSLEFEPTPTSSPFDEGDDAVSPSPSPQANGISTGLSSAAIAAATSGHPMGMPAMVRSVSEPNANSQPRGIAGGTSIGISTFASPSPSPPRPHSGNALHTSGSPLRSRANSDEANRSVGPLALADPLVVSIDGLVSLVHQSPQPPPLPPKRLPKHQPQHPIPYSADQVDGQSSASLPPSSSTTSIPASSILRRPFRSSTADSDLTHDATRLRERERAMLERERLDQLASTVAPSPRHVDPALLSPGSLAASQAAALLRRANATGGSHTLTSAPARRAQQPQQPRSHSISVPQQSIAKAPPMDSQSATVPPSTEAPPPPHIRSASASPVTSPYKHRLFENFLVLGCSPTPALLSQNLASWSEPPKILLKFPHHSSVEAADVADFAFPADVKLVRVDVTKSSSGLHSILYGQGQFQRGAHCHTFLLKTQQNVADPLESEDLYGVCVSAREMAALVTPDGATHDISCPITYCILSRYPFFELHQAVILQILMLLHLKRVKHLGQLAASADPADPLLRLRGKPLGPHQVPACVTLLKKYYECHVPGRGQSLVLPAPKLLLPIHFQRPVGARDEAAALIAQWSCQLAWAHLTAESLLDLLELALREFKLVVVDANLCMLSASVHALAPLLRPLRWSGVFLPVLPSKLAEFLEAPVPIIAGVAELPPYFADAALGGAAEEEDTALWFPSQNRLQLPKSFKRLLPMRSQLITALKPHFAELRRLHPMQPASRTLPAHLPYTSSAEAHAHIKIMLHLIETEAVVALVDYARKTKPPSNPGSPAAMAREKKMEPFVERFRETQMLSHYLQTHELDEEDY